MSTIKSPPIIRKLETKHLELDKNNLIFDEPSTSHTTQESFNNCSKNNSYSEDLKINQSLKKKLTNQLWFHGLIKRIEAQCLLRHNGDFLVRESISSGAGCYVLSGLCENMHVHFEINETKIDEGDYSISLFHVITIIFFIYFNLYFSLKMKNFVLSLI